MSDVPDPRHLRHIASPAEIQDGLGPRGPVPQPGQRPPPPPLRGTGKGLGQLVHQLHGRPTVDALDHVARLKDGWIVAGHHHHFAFDPIHPEGEVEPSSLRTGYEPMTVPELGYRPTEGGEELGGRPVRQGPGQGRGENPVPVGVHHVEIRVEVLEHVPGHDDVGQAEGLFFGRHAVQT